MKNVLNFVFHVVGPPERARQLYLTTIGGEGLFWPRIGHSLNAAASRVRRKILDSVTLLR